VIWSEVTSLERVDLAVMGDLLEMGDLAAGLGGSGILDGEEPIGLVWASALEVLRAAVFGEGEIGLVCTPLVKTSAKDLRGEVGLTGEEAIGLVWTPLLMISEKGVAEGATGLV
jgi:hypothetical protein